MKKILLFTIMLMFLFTFTINAADFRNVEYGMSIEEVKEAEGAKLIEEYDNKLIYETVLANLNTKLYYYFGDDGLAEGKIVITDFDGGNAREIYQEIQGKLIDKYGSNIKEKDKYYKEPNLKESYDLDYALRNHVYKKITIWDKKQSNIILNIKGDNGKAKLTIKYINKKSNKNKINNSI